MSRGSGGFWVPAISLVLTLALGVLPLPDALEPLRPGSYDFGRDLYFQGIGASGFVLGAIKPKPAPAEAGMALRYAATMQGLRDAISTQFSNIGTSINSGS